MRRKRLSFPGESIIDRLRWRFRDNGADGLGGGPGTEVGAPDVRADLEPADGGAPANDRPDFNAPSASASSDSSEALSDPSQRATPADPNQRGGLTQPNQQATNEWQSIRDAATAYGYQAPANITDDRAFLVHLLQQAQGNRQQDFYAQLGRQLAPQAHGIQQYLSQQTQPQQPAARPEWEAPEFDERWIGLVDRDPTTGLYVAKQGVPHDIATKVNSFVEWKTKYDRNPAAVLNQMVEARASAIAKTTFDEKFAEQSRQQTISRIMSDNSAWLYQVDAAGQRVVNPVTGQPSYSPVGAMYVQQLQAVRQMGVTDPAQQDALAKQLVRGQYALAQQQQAQAAAGQAGNPQTQQALNQPNRNPLQAQPPTQRRKNPAAPEPSQAGMSLTEMLRASLAEEGVTDADIMASVDV